jgi:hypothetical protein
MRATLVLDAEARSKLESIAKSRTEGQARIERAKVLLGYPEELWTTRTLALHAREHGPEAGHPSLARLGRGTVSKLLAGAELRPHQIEYDLERRDPEFATRMARTILRGIRVVSKAELKARIMRCLQDLNADPVVSRWRYRVEALGHIRSTTRGGCLHLHENPAFRSSWARAFP